MLFVALGSYAALAWLRGNQRSAVLGILAGMLIAFLYLLVSTSGEGSSLAQHIVALNLPWWSVSGLFAPWLGLVLALWFKGRRSRIANVAAS